MAWRKNELQLGRIARLTAGALICVSALAFACAPAQAHRYRRLHHYGHYAHYAHYPRTARHALTAAPASPAFSAIVVDANSGRTLYGAYEDGLRHPASITKVMTLY